jgi:hypothetical protein
MCQPNGLKGVDHDLAFGRIEVSDNYLGSCFFYFHSFTFEGPGRGGMMKNFSEWMQEEGFTPLGGTEGEYYECPECHVWHISSIRKLFEEKNQKKEESHDGTTERG